MSRNKSRRLAREIFWSENDKESYQCPDCGRKETEITKTFEVHHLDGNAYNNTEDNLIALCPLCHKLREGKRPSRQEMWTYRENVENLGTNGVIEKVQEIGIEERPDLASGGLDERDENPFKEILEEYPEAMQKYADSDLSGAWVAQAIIDAHPPEGN